MSDVPVAGAGVTAAQEAIRRAQQGRPLASITKAAPSPARTREAPAAVLAPARLRPRRARAPVLSPAERDQVLDTFLTLLDGLYSHLPLKRAMYASDPVQRLRLLRQKGTGLDEVGLHLELAAILTELRDAHTRYIGPASLAGQAAALPFMVEAFGAQSRPRYIVSKVATGGGPDDPHFEAGVELEWWNAVPIDRAVDLHARNETGGRPDSRRARALDSLTFRALQYGPPPDEQWVIVGYRDKEGTEREVRVDWRVLRPGRARTAGRLADASNRAYAIDPAAETKRRAKKLLFAPGPWLADQSRPSRAKPGGAATAPAVGEWLASTFQDNVAAKVVRTPSGVFGYLRLWTFDLSDDQAFVAEVVRLLGLLPSEGLILDLRANPGGLIWAAERLLQLFTPEPVEPTRFSMLATPLTRAMADAPQNLQELEPWRESLHDAVATGELYSRAAPITPTERCNDIGQVYGGPVVAVVDANTYSSGDLFAAGFYDNQVGLLVTVGEATGAGGANVWRPEDVQNALVGTTFQQHTLPAGIGYTLSVRRATRAGPAEGQAIEDVGVKGHRTYAMTKRDLSSDNQDLRAFCGKLLASRPLTFLSAVVGAGHAIQVTAKGLDRLDLTVDGRPAASLELQDGDTQVDLPSAWSTVELAAYDGELLRQRRRLHR